MIFKLSTVFLVLTYLVGETFSQKCMSQSCAIAALSGSTNESFDELVKNMGGKQPQGSDSAGKRCITKYYKQLGLKAPESLPAAKGGKAAYDAQSYNRMIRATREAAQLLDKQATGEIDKRQLGGCKPNINIFARGTTEPGTMGSTVGPALERNLAGGKWKHEGVRYSADIAGDNCIGFPGGMRCVEQLATAAKQCPESKFFLSGYSQGAMVARICAAFSKDDVKARIKGVVVFGDPFNGASIKGFPSENIKTFCSASDGVCSGKFLITPAHLAYAGSGSVTEAARWMNAKAGA